MVNIEMSIKINYNTQINCAESEAVIRAAAAVQRDIKKTFIKSEEAGAGVCLVRKQGLADEAFRIFVETGHLKIEASDDLGFIYGLYEFSRSILGIADFWFWNDQNILLRKETEIAEDYECLSKPAKVKYRGWFVNDEVLLHA